MSRLERAYRRLLLAYPRGYREARGDELVGTLLEASTPGQVRPRFRDTVDVLRHATRQRLRIKGTAAASRTLTAAAGLGLSLSAALSLVALLFGELPVWGRDPGLNANQFGYGPFETTGVYAYGLVLVSWLCYLIGQRQASRLVAVLGCAAATGSFLAASSIQERPNVTVLATLVVCLVPLLLTKTPSVRQRVGVAAVPMIAALLGVLAFAGMPTGHAQRHWDPRDRFYTDSIGLVGRLHPWVPGIALLVLAAGAAAALRTRQSYVWSAATLVLAPATVIAYGGGSASGRAYGGITARAQDNAPFVQIMAVVLTVVVVQIALSLRRSGQGTAAPTDGGLAEPPYE